MKVPVIYAYMCIATNYDLRLLTSNYPNTHTRVVSLGKGFRGHPPRARIFLGRQKVRVQYLYKVLKKEEGENVILAPGAKSSRHGFGDY